MLDREAGRIGRFAWVMAWVGLVVGQLHALSRFATADGKEDLELPWTAAWAEPAADVFAPLLDWADPDLVYVTYGKIWFPVFVAFTLCAFVVYRRRAAERASRSGRGGRPWRRTSLAMRGGLPRLLDPVDRQLRGRRHRGVVLRRRAGW